MGVLVQGGTGARRTTSSKHLFPFESKALQSSVYARFVPTAAFSLLCLLSASALVFRLPFARQSVPNIRKDRRQECGGASYLSVDGVLEASAGCIAVLEELSSCSKYAAIVVVVVVVARRAGNFCKVRYCVKFSFLSIDLLSTSIVPAYQRNYFQVLEFCRGKKSKGGFQLYQLKACSHY
jgi:hypothetical protein